jgi:hypothetical protein
LVLTTRWPKLLTCSVASENEPVAIAAGFSAPAVNTNADPFQDTLPDPDGNDCAHDVAARPAATATRRGARIFE